MADRSQAVIIIALRRRERTFLNEKTLDKYKTWLLHAATVHSHDDFLSGWIVGDVVDLLLLLWNPLHGFDKFLEHSSLPERRENDEF